jgi:hypothetical protein
MGVGIGAVKLYLELRERGVFKNIKSVVEMGSQELHLTEKCFKELMDSAGISDYKKEEISDLSNYPGYPRVSAKALYKILGVNNYSCIDLNGDHNAIQHDLNSPFQDKDFYNQYDLVTDHGTNEHAFNIAETYRTMHRLCKEQGYMIIMQNVCNGNGYYLFDSSFFEGIAAANNYRILFSSYVVTINDSKYMYQQLHIPLSRELLGVLDLFRTQSICICYVLQKQSSGDFKFPYQGNYLSQREGNKGYKLQFLPQPPSYSYVPAYGDWRENISTKVLARLLFQRLPGTLKNVFKKIKGKR